MLKLEFPKNIKSVLCIGAHADDIEIGCGATILKLLSNMKGIKVDWLVCCSDPIRQQEARLSAQNFLQHAGSVNVIIHDFQDGYLPAQFSGLKDEFENLKAKINPDIIFTHYKNDYHQDHRIVSELTWNTFRDHLVLEYEIPKYDGDINNPNLYSVIQKKEVEQKIKIILESFQSQVNKQWFNESLFRSLLRLRGMECSDTYAEAFYCRKASINI